MARWTLRTLMSLHLPMSDLRAFEDWAGALLAKIEPTKRRKINQTIARELRRSQQLRIKAQRNPDGTAYAPRKKPLQRSKKGKIKQKAMFVRLSAAARLKMSSTSEAIGISFMARNARVARVHQYGLTESPGGKSPRVKYDKRELLGFTDNDIAMIRDRLIDHLGNL